jgi:tight adherence protein B
MAIVIAAGIFITIVLLLGGSYFVFTSGRTSGLGKLRKRLGKLSTDEYEAEDIDITRKGKLLSEIPWLNRLLSGVSIMQRLHLLLEQANIPYPLGVFVLLAIILLMLGFTGALKLTSSYLIAIAAALFSGMLPYFYIRFKQKKRMRRFQEQLPAALESMARSLRAGHAFSGGLKLVAEEFADPIGPEFDKTVDEINFGVDFNVALKNLSNRIDCDDLRYFVIAVTIQRETGGNLTEILDSIAYIIRERFKLEGNIRTLAAEGKLSAYILFGLPFFIGFVVFFLNPEYIKILFTDVIGKWIIAITVIMMIIGIRVISGIVKIKV